MWLPVNDVTVVPAFPLVMANRDDAHQLTYLQWMMSLQFPSFVWLPLKDLHRVFWQPNFFGGFFRKHVTLAEMDLTNGL